LRSVRDQRWPNRANKTRQNSSALGPKAPLSDYSEFLGEARGDLRHVVM
jgi:hypothetical protein